MALRFKRRTKDRATKITVNALVLLPDYNGSKNKSCRHRQHLSFLFLF